MRQNKIPIVFAFDFNYTLPAHVAVMSLLESAKDDTFYDIFILISGISKKSKQNFENSLSMYSNYNINWIEIGDEYFSQAPTTDNWSRAVYYRLLIPNIIKQYDKVIWSDVDVVFRKDLSDIYNADLEDYYWSGVVGEYNKTAQCHQHYPENPNEFIFLSGFMVMNLRKMREENIVQKFFDNIEKYSDRLKMFDLEILNLTCNKIKSIPFDYCVIENIYDEDDITKAPEYPWLTNVYSHDELMRAKKNPSIIHYAGKAVKIWLRKRKEVNPEYLAYLDISKNSKLLVKEKAQFSNLQIGENDLLGNKFGGHDLHLYLREKNIDSSHLVSMKQSNDENTFYVSYNEKYNNIRNNITEVEESYNTQAMFYPFALDIMNYALFQDTNIVHYHLINNYFFNMNLLPIMTRMKPSVWTIHDPWLLTGHCIHPFGCKKWQLHCGDCPHLDTHFAISQDTTALNFELKHQIVQSSKLSLIVASKWMKNYVENSPITKGLPVYLVPFGVNQQLFKPKDIVIAKEELGINSNSFTIMFRADQGPFKGLDIIKEALKSIKAKNKITLLAVGEKGILKEFSQDYEIKDYGWLRDDKQLVKLYQACDLFLMPSKQEAFGMMAIEAMSCGKMVLATEGTALPDVINVPECGIVTPHLAKEYTSELQRLIDNPEIIRKRGLKSLEFAKQNYSHEVYVQRIIDVYKDVMKKHTIDNEAKFVLEQLKTHTRIKTSHLKKLNKKFVSMMDKKDYKIAFEYLNIDDTLASLAKKYKDKKIMLYGTGVLFEALCDYCDLSMLNIVAVTDKKITEETTINNYRAIPPEMIKNEQPDVILISVLRPYFIQKYLAEEVCSSSYAPEIEVILPADKIWWYS